MNEWTVKWLYRYTPDDDQNTVETYVGVDRSEKIKGAIVG
jgi:hypothetical protein